MKRSDLKSSRALQSLILVILGMVLLTAFIVFNVLGILDSRTNIGVEQNLLATAETRMAQLNELKNSEKENRSLIEEYQNLLPETYNQDILLAHVGKAAVAHHVGVPQVSFEPFVEMEGVNRVPLSITAQGKFADLMRFAESVTMDDTLVVVDGFTLSGVDGDTVLTAQCSAYFG